MIWYCVHINISRRHHFSQLHRKACLTVTLIKHILRDVYSITFHKKGILTCKYPRILSCTKYKSIMISVVKTTVTEKNMFIYYIILLSILTSHLSGQVLGRDAQMSLSGYLNYQSEYLNTVDLRSGGLSLNIS